MIPEYWIPRSQAQLTLILSDISEILVYFRAFISQVCRIENS